MMPYLKAALRRWFLLAIAALTVVLAGMFMTDSPSLGQAADTSGSPALQNMAIIVSATNKPLYVLGSDSKEHLKYDLVFTNVFPSPIKRGYHRGWSAATPAHR